MARRLAIELLRSSGFDMEKLERQAAEQGVRRWETRPIAAIWLPMFPAHRPGSTRRNSNCC